MQDKLRLTILTIIGLFILWFMIMTIDVHVFLHTDADDIVFGATSMNRTDIGNRCGNEYVNSKTMVDFKLSAEGQIIYLCPPGFSPIRSKVTATTLLDAFRQSLTPVQQGRINQFYPVVVAAPAPQPQSTPAPAAATPPPTETTPAATTSAPMSNSPPPVENTSTPVPTPAAPAS